MTSSAISAAPAPLGKRLSLVLKKIREEDSVASLTLFLAVVFGFSAWFYAWPSQLCLLLVLLVPALVREPLLWGVLAGLASLAVLIDRDLADNHKYLLCYWLWVMCIAHIAQREGLRDQIIGFNARFLLVFIFLGAALQKLISVSYMSGAMFELHLLLDSRFHAFAHLVGIDAALAEESVRRLLLIKNPYVQVLDNKIILATNDHVNFIAKLITWYDVYVQVAIGALFLFCRRITDLIAHALLLFFIFTTYLPAPVFGFGVTLSVLGFALVKERSQILTAAYLLSIVAVLCYQMPWRDWVI